MEKYSVDNVELFGDFLLYCVKKYKDDICFRKKEKTRKYSEFAIDVLKLMNNIADLSSEYILIDCKNQYYYAVSLFATIISKKIAVLLEDRKCLSFLINDIKPLGDDEVKLILKYSEDDKSDFSKFQVKDDSDRVAIIVKSSGTMSADKGIELTQRNVCSDMISGMRNYEYSYRAIYVNTLPYYHMFGVVADLLGPLYSGGEICILESKFSFFKDLSYYRPTNLNLPPSAVMALYSQIETYGFEKVTGGRLKKIMCAGAHLNYKYIDLLNEYGVKIYNAYGLTECSPCVSLGCFDEKRRNSAGLILDCNNVKISNENEILVNGSNLMHGYFQSENENMKDNWFHTGDCGYIEDNYLYVMGRIDRMIVLQNGKKINPELVESEVLGKTSVEDCVILGNSDHKTNELFLVLCMNVMPKDDTKIKNIINKISCDFEIPKFKEIICTNYKLEKTEIGKIKRISIDEFKQIITDNAKIFRCRI